MKISKIQPPPDLRSVVYEFWHTVVPNSSSAIESYKIFADGAPGIIFQHNNGNSNLYRDTVPLPITFMYGQKSASPCTNFIHGQSSIFGVSFQPATVKQLFSINSYELTDSLVDMNIFFSKTFTERLLEATSVQHLVELFSQEIYQKLLRAKKEHIIQDSVHRIRNCESNIDSALLAQQYCLSRRQFQRKFKEEVGVSPESYFRIVKFQKSLQLLKNGQYNRLSDIAYKLGYADHSHFNREFKLFSSFSPKEFLELQLPKNTYETDKIEDIGPLRIMKH
ncbi:helix-turn-helix transcriptional regulator [Sphingobacterium kitahiroshimense]|uniref:Helix-turn-helix transcriptional regulator n=1 Tax=Sphingobacterium kitahiroshimense TaxID=470446 RepID=A0ABV0BNX8_9SPHI